jgi:hypothetical protein
MYNKIRDFFKGTKRCPSCNREIDDRAYVCNCGYVFYKEDLYEDSPEPKIKEKEIINQADNEAAITTKKEKPPVLLTIANIVQSINIVVLFCICVYRFEDTNPLIWLELILFGVCNFLLWKLKAWGLYLYIAFLVLSIFSFSITRIGVVGIAPLLLLVYFKYIAWFE